MTDANAFNKHFAELAGVCWHEWTGGGDEDDLFYICLFCHTTAHKDYLPLNPNFASDPVAVLRVMRGRDEEDYTKFVMSLVSRHWTSPHNGFSGLAVQSYCVLVINKYILDTTEPCKLAVEAMKWMEKRK
jgi:hypothetical protein